MSSEGVAGAEILALNDVSKQFGGLRAVDGVSFTVKKGERVGLLGPNGAGKTTLVNCVSGDLKISSGQVRLKNEQVQGMAPHRLFALGLARTYQVVNPFPSMTVRQSTSLGALVHTRSVPLAEERAMEALRVLGLEKRADTLMSQLNIVQMKEVELARIVASGPQVVFLDEVLAGLRPSEVGHLLDVVEALGDQGGWTVVMIEHLIGAIMRFCGRVIVMNEGRVIADGSPEAVTKDDAVIDAYLGNKWRQRA